jgi:hypothetical protein
VDEAHNFDPPTSAPSNGRHEQLETVELSTKQRLRIAELPEGYRVIGVDGSAPLVRKPTGQVLRVQHNGRLTAATIRARAGSPPAAPIEPPRARNSSPPRVRPYLRQLAEQVSASRTDARASVLARFDLEDDQQALAVIDDIAQTVGNSAFE